MKTILPLFKNQNLVKMKTQTGFNYFDNAVKVDTTKKTATKEKNKVFVSGIEADLLRAKQIKIEESNLKTEKGMLWGRLKSIAEKEILRLFSIHKSRPESFKLADGAGEIMVILQDAYKKVEDAKESALEAYPDVLETKKVFSINPEILEKEGVGEALSKAIAACKGISDEDKRNLLICEETKAIKKGTIDRLTSFDNYEQLFYMIEPTIALK